MSVPILPIFSLLTSTLFLMAGAGLEGILLPVRGSIEGWSPYEIGLIGTGYAVAFTLGCIFVPPLVRRAGHVRTFTSLAALLAIAVLLHALNVHPIAWIFIRGLSGFALAGCYMIVESWLNERVTNETRGTVFSLYMVVTMVGMMGGQYIMPLSRPELTNPFMICAILFAFAVLPTALSKAPAPKDLTTATMDLPLIYRNSPAAAVGVFLAGINAGAWNSMSPVFGNKLGFSTAEIATLLVATMAGGIVCQFPLGRLSDRFDRRYVMALAGTIGFAVSILTLVSGLNTPLPLFGAAFVLGAVLYPAYSLAVAHANDYAADQDFLKISSGLLILYGFGTMGGPMVAASLMDGYGPSGIFLAVGAGNAAFALYAFYRTFRRSAPPVEEKSDVPVIPVTRPQTPTTLALDPRAEQVAAE
ncbi:MFS transporter [Mangrovibrevibacter kandeliae]|uniref:MFS transporter n=1 Tax=Mangrovibrevibacter kandeliae TaxID=2968473 RepID=UPI0021198D82|nr:MULTISPECIES: MFS transporter [unclassified Aurantimonas]MCQ8781106.1 MFS transporter [Aurantimonas sp. CSK15Z-1]MCW4113887.1 MFS transporter [Aurantimonas sp. MSK8Z-1]